MIDVKGRNAYLLLKNLIKETFYGANNYVMGNTHS